MSEDELSRKKAYFKEQELLDISDDETGFPDAMYLNTERELDNSRPGSLPTPSGRPSNFLGPTPKERQAQFEVHATRKRALTRTGRQTLTRSETASEKDVQKKPSIPKTGQGPSTKPSAGSIKNPKKANSPPKRTTISSTQVPFYIQSGTIPRELKNGKNVKLAKNIKLEPSHRQHLKDQIVYFYPNDDISMARRTRIHKVIQLGAAWVTSWRNDITHIMVDDNSYSYGQVLRHLNMSGIPDGVVLVKFDPFVPQCISFGKLQDHTQKRFLIQGQPRPSTPRIPAEPSASSSLSQSSLQIKPSAQQQAARSYNQRAFTPPKENSYLDSMEMEDIVKDSFIEASTEPNEEKLAINQENRLESSISNDKPIDLYDDALSQAIQEAKATSHLPLDEDDDSDPSRPGTANQTSDSETDVESPKRALKPTRRSKFAAAKLNSAAQRKGLDLNAFQCMNPGTSASTSQNPNARTIQVLEEMCKHHDQMQDQWRTLAYRKAITTLKKQNTKITTAKEAGALPFIGARLADKIEEIVLTNRLRKLDSTRDDPTTQVLRLFLGVYGAGLNQANKWIQAGHRTLEDLVTKAKITESQRIGIEHYDDFATRIPRAEVEAHGAVVRKALARIDARFNVTIMGSYRRGARDTGDIDLIISRPGASPASMSAVVFETLVPHLFETSFLKATLATSSRNDSTGTKWHGASCLRTSNVWRRLDLLLVPEAEMGAALIYFTGNDIFNRSMRLLARKKGMRLNQRGLYKDVARSKRGEKLNDGELVEGRDEKRIFELLGVPWREPHERIC